MTLALGISAPVSLRSTGALEGPSQGGRRIALLIGIADYQRFEADGPAGQSDLRGPRTDVGRMRTSLARFGFGDSLMTVLVDSQATLTGMRDALVGLSTQVRGPDDVVVIYFSGHGTQVPDASGDEDDAADEALVPWDAVDVRNASDVVLDDSLGVWLGALRTRDITLIVDACFSGTITRALGEARPRGGPALPTTRGAAALLSEEAIGAARRELQEVPFTLITAAAAHELAVELPWPDLDNRYSGVLTYQLTRLLDQAAGSTIRYDALMGMVRDEVRRWSRQTPQLEGTAVARASRLFNVTRDSLPPLSAPAVRRDDGQWMVRMGAVHGVRRGTTFDVTADDQGPRRALGQFLVDSVGEDQARLAPIDGPVVGGSGVATISTMPPNARAADHLRVWVSPGLRDLGPMVGKVPFARLTSDSLAADVTLTPAARGVAVRVQGVPMVALPRWRYPAGGPYAPWVSDSADLVLPSRPDGVVQYARTAGAVCTALRRAWVASGIRSVANPVRNYNLTLELRVARAGSPLPRSESTPADTLVEGETYELLVRATSFTNAPVFLSLALAGHRGIPLTSLLAESGQHASAASDSVNLKLNGGWARIRFGRATPPHGTDVITAYLGAFPYAFSQLVAQAPPCGDVGTRALERDPSITGWTAASRRIVFVPRTRSTAP